MMKTAKQAKAWEGEFGRRYTDRNPATFEEMNDLYRDRFGFGRAELNKEFLGHLDRSLEILEVGSNRGIQLVGLQSLGFSRLTGLELQAYAIEKAKNLTRGIDFKQGNVLHLPFADGFFDLVFTSGVLIHISPNDVGRALDEIHRCTRRFIWGYEYFADECVAIAYRGREDLLWKGDYAKLYLERFDDLTLVKERRLRTNEDDNLDCMYLLEKMP